MSDDELKLTRRYFLQQTAVATAMTGGMVSIAVKTDALAQLPESLRSVRDNNDGGMPYPYVNPP